MRAGRHGVVWPSHEADITKTTFQLDTINDDVQVEQVGEGRAKHDCGGGEVVTMKLENLYNSNDH